MPKAKVKPKAKAKRDYTPIRPRLGVFHCVVDHTPFAPLRGDQVYCERGKESHDSCYWTLRHLQDGIERDPTYLKVLAEQDYLCWQCHEASKPLRPILLNPYPHIINGEAPIFAAGCHECRRDYFRELAQAAN